ncbi:hypothetical protein PQX77_001200 [Marasmius sp. AFHP31]|nr:hypothetical protein PQX77_001200 [Marasmius sp. AFHP31]
MAIPATLTAIPPPIWVTPATQVVIDLPIWTTSPAQKACRMPRSKGNSQTWPQAAVFKPRADVAAREFATNLDGGTSKRQRIGAGYGLQVERIETHDHLDQTPTYLHHKNDATTDNQTAENPGEGVRPICPLPKRAMFSTDLSHQAYWSTDMETPLAGCTDLVLSASQGLHSCSSASIDPSWTDILFGTPLGMTTVPFHPAQPFESLSMPQPGMVATSYEDAGAEHSSVYANQSIDFISPSNTAFISDTSEYAGWSWSRSTPIAATSSSLYNALGSDTPAVGYPFSPTAQTHLHSPSQAKPANGYNELSTPYHSGGLAAIQQQSSPHVSATSSSYGQSGLPATNGI